MSRLGHVDAGLEIHRLVGSTDIFATILDHVGVERPSSPVSAARSLTPLLRGGVFVEEGRLENDGDLPINTGGGLLSETGVPGMQIEARLGQLNRSGTSRHRSCAT